MKRYFLLAVGVAILLSIAISTQQTQAQVYSLYGSVTITQASYRPVEQYQELNPNDFALPPNFIPTDRDNGYYRIPVQLPFPFEYNDEVYDKIWINVNGFAMFTAPGVMPPNVAPDNQSALFIQSNSYPNNVLAPFWGDHYYRIGADRFAKYIPSSIRVATEIYDPPYRVFIIEWKDLNIMDKSVQSSVGNFQLRLYESKDPYSFQGDIEFAYGQIGSPDLDPSVGTLVIYRGATVGLKGESQGTTGDDADYMNGLEYDQLPQIIRTSRAVTNQWTPSGGTDKRIHFTALVTKKIDEWWGDGDANLSKAVGRKHFLMPQNRFVTVEDARVIMRSVAKKVPLDSIRRREAYHGDVTHNGRFYYDKLGQKVNITWRSKNVGDDLPPDVTSIKRILYQVTEYDASMILNYIAARVPDLPWIYDTVVRKGKAGIMDQIASSIQFGSAIALADNQYTLPVYINGRVDGPISFKFDVDGDVLDVNTPTDLISTNSDSRVVVAGSGEFDASSPVAYITIKSQNPEVNFNDIRFNDNEVGSLKTKLYGSETIASDEIMSQNTPNPFTTRTMISLNLREKGNYNLAIFDAMGNRIKTLSNADLNSGVNNFFWDGTDENGNVVGAGVYVYRLTGDNVSLAKKLVLTR